MAPFWEPAPAKPEPFENHHHVERSAQAVKLPQLAKPKQTTPAHHTVPNVPAEGNLPPIAPPSAETRKVKQLEAELQLWEAHESALSTLMRELAEGEVSMPPSARGAEAEGSPRAQRGKPQTSKKALPHPSMRAPSTKRLLVPRSRRSRSELAAAPASADPLDAGRQPQPSLSARGGASTSSLRHPRLAPVDVGSGVDAATSESHAGLARKAADAPSAITTKSKAVSDFQRAFFELKKHRYLPLPSAAADSWQTRVGPTQSTRVGSKPTPYAEQIVSQQQWEPPSVMNGQFVLPDDDDSGSDDSDVDDPEMSAYLGFRELFREDMGGDKVPVVLLGEWRKTRFQGRAHVSSRFTAKVDAWRQRGPAITQADVGKVLKVHFEELIIDGKRRSCRWAGAEHHNVSHVKIRKVEEKIKGVVMLANGTTIQNPVLETDQPRGGGDDDDRNPSTRSRRGSMTKGAKERERIKRDTVAAFSGNLSPRSPSKGGTESRRASLTGLSQWGKKERQGGFLSIGKQAALS